MIDRQQISNGYMHLKIILSISKLYPLKVISANVTLVRGGRTISI